MLTREQKIAYHRKYNEEHKEQIRSNLLRRVPCEYCGKEISKVNLKTHQQTKKCKRHQNEATTFEKNDISDTIINHINHLLATNTNLEIEYLTTEDKIKIIKSI